MRENIKIEFSWGLRIVICLVILNIVCSTAYAVYKLWEVLFC